MTAKEYLQQAFHIDQRISIKLDMVSRLRDSATRITSRISDMPRASSPNLQTMEDMVAKIVDMEAEINQNANELVNLKRDIISRISELDKAEYRLILENRYLNYKSWEEIALDMHVSRRRVYQIHGSALSALDTVLSSSKGNQIC